MLLRRRQYSAIMICMIRIMNHLDSFIPRVSYTRRTEDEGAHNFVLGSWVVFVGGVLFVSIVCEFQICCVGDHKCHQRPAIRIIPYQCASVPRHFGVGSFGSDRNIVHRPLSSALQLPRTPIPVWFVYRRRQRRVCFFVELFCLHMVACISMWPHSSCPSHPLAPPPSPHPTVQ